MDRPSRTSLLVSWSVGAICLAWIIGIGVWGLLVGERSFAIGALAVVAVLVLLGVLAVVARRRYREK